MSKIYLKTYCYAPHEIEFVIANLSECYDHIEKMIVCEFDINHTGVKRDFEFQLKDYWSLWETILTMMTLSYR